MPKIRITVPEAGVEAVAELNDTQTAKKLIEALPCEESANRWGDEIYFEVPVDMPEEDAKATVPSGAIAYWPPGKAFCVFFGQTPYSPVNVIGKLEGDEGVFKAVQSGQTVRVEAG